MIFGVLRFSPSFQYTHARILTEAQQVSYRYWLSQGVDTQQLWFFDVEGSCQMHEIPLADFCKHRYVRCFSKMPTLSSTALSFRVLESNGTTPVWMEGRENSINLCVVLPRILCKKICAGQLPSFALPSPLGNGFWSAPQWFQKSLGEGLLRFFDTSKLHAEKPIAETLGCLYYL